MATEVKVKSWWKSVSLWIVILTAVGMVLDKLALDGVIPNEGWYVIAATVIGLVTKRGMTENAAMKATAITTAAGIAVKGDPENPIAR